MQSSSTAGSALRTKTVALDNNIDLSEHIWITAGNNGHAFEGTFDGGGYTVSGMIIEEANIAHNQYYAGLFGWVDADDAPECMVKNLTVSGNINIVLNGDAFIGGISAYCKAPFIDCVSDVDINIIVFNCTDDGALVGGIASVSSNGGGFLRCENHGDINVISDITCDVGGITAGSAGDYNIIDCSNSGNITVESNLYATVGGIVGDAGNTSNPQLITGCTNSGNITAVYSSIYNMINIGGIAGSASAHIENCINNGALSSANMTTIQNEIVMGGIAGYLVGEGDSTKTIESCINNGAITVDGYFNICTVGGLCGLLQFDTILNSCNTGNIARLENVTRADTATVSIGEFVGQTHGDEEYVYNSYNRGTILADGNSFADSTNIYNCYSLPTGAESGTWWHGDTDIAPAGVELLSVEIKPLSPTLNTFVNEKNADGGHFNKWYINSEYNSSYPQYEPMMFSVSVAGSFADDSGEGEYIPGDTVTLNAGSRSGYELEGWTSAGRITFSSRRNEVVTFTMPAGNVDVTANWKKSGSGLNGGILAVDIFHTITSSAGKGGEISPSGKNIYPDYLDPAFTVTPEKGYEIKSVTVDGIDVTNELNGNTYTFRNLTNNRTIHVEFLPIARYDDVGVSDWFYDDVMFVSDKWLMSGTGEATFSPESRATRGVAVEALWKLEGMPASDYVINFSDVDSSVSCYDAIRWAAENKIILGYEDGTFGTERLITREQMSAVFRRFAAYKGLDTSKRGDLSGFSDSPSAWAREDISWSVGEELIIGKGGFLDPTGNIKRCEYAAMLRRFAE